MKAEAVTRMMDKSVGNTGLKGISRLGNRYRARFNFANKSISLGCYDTPQQAAEARMNFIVNTFIITNAQ